MISEERLKELEKFQDYTMFVCMHCGTAFGWKKPKCTDCGHRDLQLISKVVNGQVEVKAIVRTGLMFGTRRHKQT